MTAEDAFLAAIRAAPDDDTPRLVFADWLEEHGDAAASGRAELIRVQCELARWVPDLTRRTALQARASELIQLHGLQAGDGLWDWPASCKRERITNTIGMDLSLIPAGTFLMGAPEAESDYYPDELPQHIVTISRPFYLGVYPVTQRQYAAVMGVNPSDFNAGNSGSPDHPVDTVSWHDAVEFCRRLSELAGEKAAGRVYRLPTEAEWEHACRAGSTTPYHFGAACSGLEANCDGQYPYGGAPRGPFLQRTTKVGFFAPNVFGLFDTHGNIWEWCADWYDRDYYRRSPAVDPPGPSDGEERVLRGGSWFFRAQRCRSAARLGVSPEGSYHIDGFRVAVTV